MEATLETPMQLITAFFRWIWRGLVRAIKFVIAVIAAACVIAVKLGIVWLILI